MPINQIVGLFSIVLCLLWTPRTIAAVCPFCSASGQTLRQEMETMDVVGIVTLVSASESANESFGSFRFEKVLKGASLIDSEFQPQATYLGKPKSKARFLLMGVDPARFVWSSPLMLSAEGERYVEKLLDIPDNIQDRLAHFQEYFENEDVMISRDAYDEFAITTYDDIVTFGPRMNRKRLVEWLQDPSISPPRKRLYYTMLGICGKPEDISWLEEKMLSKNDKDKVGLDAMVAAYLMLKGEDGLPLIVEKFLKNEESDYVAVHSIVSALRFHGTEGKRIEAPKLASALAALLDRMDLADLAIPELAALEDWTHLDQMMELFKKAKKPHDGLIRAPIINFMRVCPLPKANELLMEMEKIDPVSVQRAKTHFPIRNPKPAKETRRKLPPNGRQLASMATQSEWKPGFAMQSEGFQKELRVAYLDSEAKTASMTTQSPQSSEISHENRVLNRWGALFVVFFSTITLGLSMWFVGTGGLR